MGQHVSLPFFSHNAMFYFRNSIHDDVSQKKSYFALHFPYACEHIEKSMGSNQIL